MAYDVIIIGTGAGGGALLYQLKHSGKNILVLERGTFLPQEKENWDTNAVFKDERYHTKEVWKTGDGQDIHPGTGYWVGGNTKVYGAALFRLREKDFETVEHYGGAISPPWPISYKDLEGYYAKAELLFDVHGQSGDDPTEAWRSAEYPYPPVTHEPRIQEVHDALVAQGLHPFYLPIGVKLNEADRTHSPCIRCDTCDGFPCLLHAKADSDINCVRPALLQSNVTLMTGAKVVKLHTDATGKMVTGVEVEQESGNQIYSAPIVVLSAGAINSAALLLRSANEQHPNGLANSSDQVGRNLMKHHNLAMLGISTKLNLTKFQKTIAVNDFYWGDDEFKYPMGHVQLLGKSNKDMLALDAPGFTPGFALDEMATHSVDWWMTGEDLPQAENRVTWVDDQIHLAYTDNHLDGFNRLVERWTHILKVMNDGQHSIIPHSLYLKKTIPIQGVAHQCGTVRFGTDPTTSVLDVNCKAHDLDNLYVVDGSFFPSSGAVNPSLTIVANALRVGEHILAVG